MIRPLLATSISLLMVAGASAQQDAWLAEPVDDATFRAYLEFFRYQTDLPFETVVQAEVSQDGISVEQLSYQSTPEVRVEADLYRPTGVDADAIASVILLTGATPVGRRSPRYRLMSAFLARAGIQVLAMDVLHFGDRADGLLDSFSDSERHDRLYNNEVRYLDWVLQTVKDVGRSYDFLVQERGADPGRIGIVGESRGGVLSTIAAGADQRLAAAAILHGGHFDAGESGHAPAACPANYIGRISPRPLMMINGEEDNIFSPQTSIRPLQELAQDRRYLRWNSGRHTALTPEDSRALVSFLQEHLQ